MDKAKLSRMNMANIGRWFMRKKMKAKNVAPISSLLSDFCELEGKIIACEMTMDIMGVSEDNLDTRWTIEIGGVALYLDNAMDSQVTLYI